jgi:hypothetical protein
MDEPIGKVRQSATEVRSNPVIEQTSLKSATFLKGFQRQRLLAGLALLSTSSVLLLSGCSSTYQLGGPATGTPMAQAKLSGKVHGGNPPVTGATISLYEIGADPGTGSGHTGTTAAGYGAALPPPSGGVTGALIAQSTTDSFGSWSLTYTCADSADELYLVATGGNPGLAPGTNNTALIMTSVAGQCNNLFGSSFDIDEVSTVATEFALSGFSTSYLNLGTSDTNTVGLINAFATVPNLVNLSPYPVTEGAYGSVAGGNAWPVAPAYKNPPANSSSDVYQGIVPYDTINTLADVLTTCVNTINGSSSQCTSLFNITGGSLALPVGDDGVQGPAPATNTADAALYIAHNPYLPASSGFQNSNVTNLYNLASANEFFTPILSKAPASDFTLTLNYTGGGLGGLDPGSWSASTYIAIDQQGNIWIPNSYNSGLFELANNGQPLSPSTTVDASTESSITDGGYQGGGLTTPTELAIDQNDNVWVGSDDTNCLAKYINGTGYSGSSPFTTLCPSGKGGVNGTSVDGNNQIWLAGTAFINAATTAGTIATGSFPITTGFSHLTGFLGPDYAGNTWYTDGGNGEFGDYNGSGALQGSSPTNKLVSPTNYSAFGTYTGSGGCGATCLSVFTISGTQVLQTFNTNNYTTLPPDSTPATMIAAAGMAVDGNGRVYIAAEGDGVPANVTVLLKNGNSISPEKTGYQGGSAFTSLDTPTGVSVDQSGNVWVVNESSNQLGYGTYYGNGANAANVTEFIGLGAPVNPVYSLAAKNQTYGTEP